MNQLLTSNSKELFSAKNFVTTYLLLTFVIGIFVQIFCGYSIVKEVTGKPILVKFDLESTDAKADPEYEPQKWSRKK